MSDRPSRTQLVDQLADRCDEVSRLRAELAAMRADRDDWREIARATLVRNATMPRVVVIEPKATTSFRPVDRRDFERQAAAYRAAVNLLPKGEG